MVGQLEPCATVDGVVCPLAEARLALTDDGVARGDGAFETVGVWDGRAFRLDDHLARLDGSLRGIGLPKAPLPALRSDIDRLLAGIPRVDAALRLYVTGSGTRVASISPPPDRPPLRALVPQPAPWIRPLGTYGPAGAKTMSYGPNMAATRAAVRAGGDDALLVSLEGAVLEGPTFAVVWTRAGRLRAPATELGLVDSISRRTLLEVAAVTGIDVEVGRYPLADLDQADEVLVCSSVRPLQALERVGGHRLPGDTPVFDRLAGALERRRRGGDGPEPQ